MPPLSRPELQHAYNSLLKLKNSIEQKESEEVADPNEPTCENFLQEVDTTLSLLRSKLDKPQSLASNMTEGHLTTIKLAGIIVLKSNFKEHLLATTSLGENKLWSSANLHHQLQLLESLVPRMTESSAHAWINAFLFRVSTMLPPDKHMVFNMKHKFPATTISPSFSNLFNFFDYTAVVSSQHTASVILKDPCLQLKMHLHSAFFIAEAKLFNPSAHVPQVVDEMYACGKHLQKKVLRGALTNGHDWIFLLIKLNDNYDGASYMQSDVVSMPGKSPDGELILGPWPDLIAAILLHWIENSFEEFGSDDWFELV